MIQGRARCGPSFRTLISMAAAMAIAAGCMAADETPAVDTVVTDTTGTDTTGGGGPAPATGDVVVLSRSIDSYAGPGGRAAFDSVVAHLETVDWKGSARDRDCTGGPCNNPNVTTRVVIEGLEGAHDINLSAVPDSGVIIGRMMNTGPHTERLYGLAPGNSVRVYYMVVEPLRGVPPTSNREQAVLRLVGVRGQGNAPLVFVDQHGDRRITSCGHAPDSNGDSTHADFVNCDSRHGSGVADTGATARMAQDDTGAAASTVFRRARGWIACVHGCCEVGES